LVQQPEDEDLEVNDNSFDLELGIYDPTNKKFIATSVNAVIDFEGHKIKGIDGKLDFSVLQWEVKPEMVGKEVKIMFRALNFT
jgi:hypothetical protein